MSQHSTPSAADTDDTDNTDEPGDTDEEASTVDMTTFETASLPRLQQLTEGDTVAVRYDSPYSDEPQTVEGEVTHIETDDHARSDFTGVVAYIDPEGRDERDEYYREVLNRPPRRINGHGDGDLNTFVLEARNGARWNRLSRGGTPEIKLAGTAEGGEGQ
jgi:hypothetical protein